MEPYVVRTEPGTSSNAENNGPSTAPKTVQLNKYRAFMGLMHVKKATFVIGIYEIFLFVLSVFGFAFGAKHHLAIINETNLVINVVFGAVLMVMVCIMFTGLRKENGNYMIPHLAWQVVGIIGLFVGMVFMIIYQSQFDSVLFYFLIAFICMRIGCQVYFFTIVYNCCMYLYDKPYFTEPDALPYAATKNDLGESFWNFRNEDRY